MPLPSGQTQCQAYITGGHRVVSGNRYSHMLRFANSARLASKLPHKSKMPAFTLYGSRGSTNTDRVRLTLAEGGFEDYELVLLNLQKGEQKVSDPLLVRIDADVSLLGKSCLLMFHPTVVFCSLYCNVQLLRKLTPSHLVRRTHQTSSMG